MTRCLFLSKDLKGSGLESGERGLMTVDADITGRVPRKIT